MKCDRCGYECYEKYCPMCGYKMPFYQDNGENPYVKNEKSNDYSNYRGTAPENNNGAPCNNASFSFNTSPDFNGNQNTPDLNSDFTGNVYSNANRNIGAPQQMNYTQPQGNANFQGKNTPPQYKNQYTQNGQKKKSRVVAVILVCLAVAVVAAGAVLGIWSANTYNRSVIDNLFNDFPDIPYNNEPYYDDYGYDSEMIEDNRIYKIGEAKELPNCEVKFIGAEREKGADKSKSGNSRVTITFEIKNTTDSKLTLGYIYCDVYESSELKYPDVYYDWLSDNLTDEATFELEPNETKKLTMDYAVPNDVDDLDIDLSISHYDDPYYDYYGYFTTKK